MHILLIDHHKTTSKLLGSKLDNSDIIDVAQNADLAINMAAENNYDLVIMEMSLEGHSGLEFLYEFKSYKDWIDIPIIVYSMLKLEPEVVNSRAWQDLKIINYFYKPETSVDNLLSAINDCRPARNETVQH